MSSWTAEKRDEVEVGDVVIVHGIDGPKMVVNDIIEEVEIECIWFDKNHILYREMFNLEYLWTVVE